MKEVLKTLCKIFADMNIVSKYALKYGTSLILSLAVCAVYFYFTAESAENPYACVMMYTDILYSIKEYIGAVYVLPLTAEIIFIAAGKKPK